MVHQRLIDEFPIAARLMGFLSIVKRGDSRYRISSNPIGRHREDREMMSKRSGDGSVGRRRRELSEMRPVINAPAYRPHVRRSENRVKLRIDQTPQITDSEPILWPTNATKITIRTSPKMVPARNQKTGRQRLRPGAVRISRLVTRACPSVAIREVTGHCEWLIYRLKMSFAKAT